jgi:hypothetical protein
MAATAANASPSGCLRQPDRHALSIWEYFPDSAQAARLLANALERWTLHAGSRRYGNSFTVGRATEGLSSRADGYPKAGWKGLRSGR